MKSVTIWFQNKRQTERKVALTNPLKTNGPFTLSNISSIFSAPSHATPSTHPYPIPSHSSQTSSQSGSKSPTQLRTSSSYLSLDHVASRAELPVYEPRTPRRSKRAASPDSNYDLNSAVWEDMPSSPIQPEPDSRSAKSISPDSPTTREYLDFAAMRRSNGKRARGRKSLEWACAAARLNAEREDENEDEPHDTPSSSSLRVLDWDRLPLAPSQSFDTESISTCIDDEKTECAETEVESLEDSHEAITPSNSQNIGSNSALSRNLSRTKQPLDLEHPSILTYSHERIDDAEIQDNYKDLMDVAWALCGLGTQRT